MGMQWSDVPVDIRPMFLKAIEPVFFKANGYSLTSVIQALDSMQVPWKENDVFIEEIFLSAVRLLSNNTAVEILNSDGGNHWRDELLDFCFSRIDHSMLSNIISK
jgi:hypothetical protein